MIAYRDLYNQLEGTFDGCELRHVGRESNEEADILANLGSNKAPVPPGVFLECITQRSVKLRPAPGSSTSTTSTADPPSTEKEPMEVLLIEPTWTTPYLAYILQQRVPTNPVEAKRVIRRRDQCGGRSTRL